MSTDLVWTWAQLTVGTLLQNTVVSVGFTGGFYHPKITQSHADKIFPNSVCSAQTSIVSYGSNGYKVTYVH